jgi:hypothetical protein
LGGNMGHDLLKSEEQGFCKIWILKFSLGRSNAVPRAGCTVLYPQIYVYQRDVIGLGFCEADRQCDQSNSGLFPSLARVSGVHGPDSSDSCRTFGTIWPNWSSLTSQTSHRWSVVLLLEVWSGN